MDEYLEEERDVKETREEEGGQSLEGLVHVKRVTTLQRRAVSPARSDVFTTVV